MSPQCTFRGGPYYHLGQGRCPLGHVLPPPSTSLLLDPPGPHLKRLTRVCKVSQQAHSIVQNKNIVHIILPSPLLLQFKKYHKPRQTSSQSWFVLPNLKMNYASFGNDLGGGHSVLQKHHHMKLTISQLKSFTICYHIGLPRSLHQAMPWQQDITPGPWALSREVHRMKHAFN